MRTFRKKPVTVQAIRTPARGEEASLDLVALVQEQNWEGDSEGIIIPTLEGDHLASPEDVIIRGIKGEYYPCKPDIFDALYDSVDDEEEAGDPAVDSTSDDRVTNNLMRHTYRVLGDKEKADMQHLKDLGYEFISALHDVGGSEFTDDARQSSRELSVAQTKIEEAVMWAVKHVTR
jgi:hypothetical protein